MEAGTEVFIIETPTPETIPPTVAAAAATPKAPALAPSDEPATDAQEQRPAGCWPILY